MYARGGVNPTGRDPRGSEQAEDRRQKRGPWEKKDHYECPENGQGDRVVVQGLSPAQESQKVFVDEVMPQEPWITLCGDKVPRNGHYQE
jgi:hypothetical protein